MTIHPVTAGRSAVAHSGGQVQKYPCVHYLALRPSAGAPQTFQSLFLVCGETDRLPLRGEWHKPFSHNNVPIV
jgi:hypothetical protein